jgi:hypothetical protein
MKFNTIQLLLLITIYWSEFIHQGQATTKNSIKNYQHTNKNNIQNNTVQTSNTAVAALKTSLNSNSNWPFSSSSPPSIQSIPSSFSPSKQYLDSDSSTFECPQAIPRGPTHV